MTAADEEERERERRERYQRFLARAREWMAKRRSEIPPRGGPFSPRADRRYR